MISCGARLAVFDIAELREVTAYDELELDTLGDRKTALFLIMSDTDDSFNFLISMCYTQLFNLLCEKADDVYGGRLPVHVRCLIDECANIGQIPKLEKLVATIRSREISACLVLQAQSQLKAIYIQNLKGWITELSEKRKELLAEKAAEEAVFLPNLLMKYMEVRKTERSDWTRAGQNRGTSKDLKAVSEALSYLKRKGLSTVEDLENFIEMSGKSAADYRKQMKAKENRSNVIDAILAARTDYKECKPVYEKYQKIFFKKTKEKFKLEHPEVARFEKASAYLAKHPEDKDSTKKELLQEQAKFVDEIADLKAPLTEVQEDLKKLRDIRYWVRKATPGTEESKEPPKKQPIKEVLQDKADEKKAQRTAPEQTKHRQQDMEL